MGRWVSTYDWDANGINRGTYSGVFTQQNQPMQFSTKWKHVGTTNTGLVHYGARTRNLNWR